MIQRISFHYVFLVINLSLAMIYQKHENLSRAFALMYIKCNFPFLWLNLLVLQKYPGDFGLFFPPPFSPPRLSFCADSGIKGIFCRELSSGFPQLTSAKGVKLSFKASLCEFDIYVKTHWTKVLHTLLHSCCPTNFRHQQRGVKVGS